MQLVSYSFPQGCVCVCVCLGRGGGGEESSEPELLIQSYEMSFMERQDVFKLSPRVDRDYICTDPFIQG